MPFEVSDHIFLPVGFDWEGTRYKELYISTMNGHDEVNMSGPKIKNNGAKSMTIFLRRCVQEIVGLVDRKSDSKRGKFSAEYFRVMSSPDRDFIFLASQALAMEKKFMSNRQCPQCGDIDEFEVDIEKLDILEWDAEDAGQSLDDIAPEFTIDLLRPEHYRNNLIVESVTWRVITGAQQEQIAAQAQSKQGSAMLAAGIVGMSGYEGRPDSEMIQDMCSRNRKHIGEMVKELTPGFDLRQEAFCGECQHEWRADIDLTHFFNSAAQTPQRKGTGKGGKGGRKKRRRRLRKR